MNRSARIRGEARPGPGSLKLVADNLRRFAALREMPMAHLADRAGIGRAVLWRLLDPIGKGASNPRLGTLEALADALDVELTDLLRPAPEAAS